MGYRAEKFRERALTWLVWRLPRSVIYWSAIRLGAHATTGHYGDTSPPDMRFMTALERWKR